MPDVPDIALEMDSQDQLVSGLDSYKSLGNLRGNLQPGFISAFGALFWGVREIGQSGSYDPNGVKSRWIRLLSCWVIGLLSYGIWVAGHGWDEGIPKMENAAVAG